MESSGPYLKVNLKPQSVWVFRPISQS